MRLQVLQDTLGNQTGVYLPIEYWNLIKSNYPDIELLGEDLEQWEKDFIDERLVTIEQNPNRLKPINELFEILKQKI